jgi:WhiB family redox-sensing transcriptional regulator
MGPDLFFPGRGEDGVVAKARAICGTCPVAEECAEYGAGENFGIWGGTSGRDRRSARSPQVVHISTRPRLVHTLPQDLSQNEDEGRHRGNGTALNVRYSDLAGANRT